MAQFYFSEEQKFNQLWVWIILLPVIVIVGVQIFDLLNNNESLNLENESLTGMIISIVVVAAVAALFMTMKLTTRIDKLTIRVRFYPFINRTIPWQDVEEAYVRTYKPLLEYGGWGIRRRIGSIAYSVSGKQGLQLSLTNGKKVLIGTKKVEELKSLLQKRELPEEF